VPTGWYLAGDGRWYESAVPPAPGWWLTADARWHPPESAPLWVDDAGAEPWRRSRWGLGDCWWGALAFVVANVAFSIVIAVALVARDGSNALDDLELGAYSIAFATLGNVVAFLGIPWIATRRKGLRSLSADFGLRFRAIDVPIGAGIGIASMIAAAIVGTAIDQSLDAPERTSNMPVESLGSVGQFLAMLLAVGIVTPVIEELFFRGLLYRSLLKRGMRVATAFPIAVLVFTVPHLLAVPEWPGVLSLFASIAVLGTGLNLACHLTGNRLGAGIVAHAVINSAAVILLFAQ
jgi:membrane protease YdiL (CAAX protease family)